MSTPCNKYGSDSDVESMKRSIEGRGSELQGDIGERIAAEVALEVLGFTPEPFDIRTHGIDLVFRDKQGNLVLIEAKLTEAGIGSIAPTKFGKEGFPSWIARQTEEMKDENTDKYSPDNSRIANEIDRIGSENVRSMAICTDPQTHIATVYERIGDSWQVVTHTQT